MEDKREAEVKLNEALDGKGEGGEAGGNALHVDLEAGKGSDEVSEEVGVGGARERAAGDTGPGRGAEPALGALVDAEMGGDGALKALLGQDAVAFGGRQAGCLDGATRKQLLAEKHRHDSKLTARVREEGRCPVVCGRRRAYRTWVLEMRAATARRGTFWLKSARKEDRNVVSHTFDMV